MGLINKIFAIGITQRITAIIVYFIVGQSYGIKHSNVIRCLVCAIGRC